MIHEGTHGIQAMDLLGRKVLMEEGRGLQLLAERMLATAAKAELAWPQEAAALRDALQQVGQATQKAWDGAEPAQALANAVPYLQAFGHTVIAWIWLDVAACLVGHDSPAAQGRRASCRYFFRYELPKIGAWLNVVRSRDSTCADLPEEAF
jgi:butyryl-CoA dehydrogenase